MPKNRCFFLPPRRVAQNRFPLALAAILAGLLAVPCVPALAIDNTTDQTTTLDGDYTNYATVEITEPFSPAPAMRSDGSAGESSVNAPGGVLRTWGDWSDGIYAQGGGTATNAGSIATSGTGSEGIYSLGGGTATNAGSIATSGDGSDGIYSLDGGTATNAGSIATSGLFSDGIYSGGGGTATNAGSIATSGDASDGILSEGGGTVTNAGSIAASGASHGILSSHGTVYNTGTVSASGANSHAIYAIDASIHLQTGTQIPNGDVNGLPGSNNNHLFLDGSGTVDFAITGTWDSLAKTGAGTWTIARDIGAAISGGTTIDAGTLQIGAGGTSGSIAGDIADNGALVFNRSDDLAYAGAISGTGTLTKTGAGTLTLTGTRTYTGGTTINGGTLLVNGSIANSPVTVRNGAVVGGSGTLGSLVVAGGGTVAPGNSVGTLHVAGDWTLGSGATYAVELRSGGNAAGTHNDLIEVANTATIRAGAAIRVTPENGTDDGSTYADGATYTILRAGTLAVEADPAITDDFAYLDFTGSYDTANFYLTSSLAVTSFQLPGQTANQRAAGDGVFSLGPGNALYDAALNMSAAQAAAAFDALSGEVHASARSALLRDASLVRDTTLGRLRAAAAAAPRDSEDPLWIGLIGGVMHTDGDGNAAGLDSRDYGFVAGLDDTPGGLGGNWRLGMLAGYSHTGFDVDDRASSGDSDNLHAGLYGGRQWGPLGLRLGLAHTWHWIDTERRALGQTLSGERTARTFQAFGEAGYAFAAGMASMEPFANAAYVRFHADGFDEDGGTAALRVAGEDSETGFTTCGLRAAAKLAPGGLPLVLRGSLGWRHAEGDIVPESAARFLGGSAFTVRGAPIARDAAVAEAGLELSLSDNVSLNIGYGGQLADDARAHDGRARLTVRF